MGKSRGALLNPIFNENPIALQILGKRQGQLELLLQFYL